MESVEKFCFFSGGGGEGRGPLQAFRLGHRILFPLPVRRDVYIQHLHSVDCKEHSVSIFFRGGNSLFSDIAKITGKQSKFTGQVKTKLYTSSLWFLLGRGRGEERIEDRWG